MVGVAQLVRALDCGSRSRGFKSPLSHPIFSIIETHGPIAHWQSIGLLIRRFQVRFLVGPPQRKKPLSKTTISGTLEGGFLLAMAMAMAMAMRWRWRWRWRWRCVVTLHSSAATSDGTVRV